MEHWSSRYVGMPYRQGEFDCVHFLVLVQREVFGRNVVIDLERTDHIFKQSKQIGEYKDHYLDKVDDSEAQDGDAVLMRGAGRLNHIGILALIGGVRYVVHNTLAAGAVTIHKLSNLGMYNLEVEGFYRCIEKAK